MEPNEDRIRERAYALWVAAGEPDGDPDRFWFAALRETMDDEQQYDDTVEDSFPASDPPGTSGITGPEPEPVPVTSTRTTGNDTVGDPGGTHPTQPASGGGDPRLAHAVSSGDRNEEPALSR